MSEILRKWHNITLAGAKRVRDRALLQASKLGISVSVVVVDRNGVILLMETQDDAPPGSADASIRKARGASRYGVATHLTAEYLKNLSAPLAQHALSLPDVCAFQGGVPIRFEGELLGGVGVSGGSGEQDIAIAVESAAGIS
jgi:uncharacterized protein GlcG (DUF336 family)